MERDQRHRLLVVDDDPATLESIRDLLRHAGFEVDTARSGRDALAQLLDNELPSAIVLDVRMPVMTGEELVTIIRSYARLAGVPILLVTAADVPGALARSVDAILRKPFRADDLLERVDALVSRPVAIAH